MCVRSQLKRYQEYEMRNLFQNFKKSDSGASLVEYAVALIVVTIIGGAGVIAIGSQGGALTGAACTVVDDARTEAGATAGATTC